ncbi:MAG: NUDIX domain-containing protein [Planctomycetota bacterium]|nr:NUDIX domain-containing protein [Planctomycetota bacterium]
MPGTTVGNRHTKGEQADMVIGDDQCASGGGGGGRSEQSPGARMEVRPDVGGGLRSAGAPGTRLHDREDACGDGGPPASEPDRSGAGELFVLVDEAGRPVGAAPRRLCHSDPRLIHAVVHVMVFDRAGRILLQKRSPSKDIQPNKWDTSVGGHMRPGEAPEAAALREMAEEVGAAPEAIEPAYSYLWRSDIETEFVRTYAALCEGPFRFDTDEVAEGRFWSIREIESNLGKDVFTPNFEVEFRKMGGWLRRRSSSFPGRQSAASADPMAVSCAKGSPASAPSAAPQLPARTGQSPWDLRPAAPTREISLENNPQEPAAGRGSECT